MESSQCSKKSCTWEHFEFQIWGLGILNLPVLIEIHDEMFKDCPKKGDGHSAFLMSALVVSSPAVSFLSSFHILSSVLLSSFAMKHSLNTELLKLGLVILGVVTGIQAGVPHFRRLLPGGSSLSSTAHASLPLLSGQ